MMRRSTFLIKSNQRDKKKPVEKTNVDRMKRRETAVAEVFIKNWGYSHLCKFSQSVQDMLGKILVKDPELRPPINACMKH